MNATKKIHRIQVVNHVEAIGLQRECVFDVAAGGGEMQHRHYLRLEGDLQSQVGNLISIFLQIKVIWCA